MGRRARAALLCVAALAVFVWWIGGDRPAETRDAERPVAVPIASAPRVDGPAVGAVGPALPASLRGTEPDGALPFDANGELVVTRDVLDFFEYYLSATGEEPLAAIRARIVAEIEARLPPTAQAAALDLLERTLAYREAVRALHAEGLAGVDLERRLQRIREVRRAFFSAPEREAFFAAEETRWSIDLESRRVALDPRLDAAERASRLAALEERLPPQQREARSSAQAATQLRQDEAVLREKGASDAEIHALRADRFGPEAAERLRALDERRAAFQERLDAWWSEAERLREDGATASELDAARAQRFEGPELLRVEALERARSAG